MTARFEFGDIQYRAFGQIKQMDYLLPTETPEIKLGYDNRLRVNHNEVTKPNGFVMKADFTHGNDSRVTAKNDLLDDKWDRTMKYDFAGRLTHNQFGMGQSNNNGSVRVYEQALEYDGFSNLSGRSGVNWGAAISFSESYSNGRIQSSLVGYDAAGNVVSQPIDSMPEGTGTSTNDSAGRRVRYFDQRFGRFNGYLNMVQENVTEYVFDGDGRPVVAKHNQRTYQRSAPPSGGLTAMPKTHQVWSTVLGTNLRTIGEIGEGTNSCRRRRYRLCFNRHGFALDDCRSGDRNDAPLGGIERNLVGGGRRDRTARTGSRQRRSGHRKQSRIRNRRPKLRLSRMAVFDSGQLLGGKARRPISVDAV
ncbi:MAG: hypothetical protein IPK58_06020 [Acidobacteria bacterium]|nr:hypothetical protein [Acidobacteriota bacterium]